METPEGSPLPVTNNQVTVPITPYQIQTVRIDYHQPSRSVKKSRPLITRQLSSIDELSEMLSTPLT